MPSAGRLLAVEPEFGSGELVAEAERLGYESFVTATVTGVNWAQLEKKLGNMLKKDLWLASEIARLLDCSDPLLPRALTVAATGLPRLRTVETWADALGLPNRQALDALFKQHGSPPPRRLLDWLRLAVAVQFAIDSDLRLSRDHIAKQCYYGNGAYLGKRAKRLTGYPFGDLVRMGTDGFLNLMRRSLGSLDGATAQDRPPRL